MSRTHLLSSAIRGHLVNSVKFYSNYLRNSSDVSKVFSRDSSTNVTKKKTASSVYRTMNVFDRKAKRIQRERSAQREDYHLSEYIKEEVGYRTADRILDIKRLFKNAVELGAGRGYVSRHLLPDSVEKVILCDTSPTHLDKAIVGEGVQHEKMVMDEENIDFPENSMDLVVSSLCLHWVNDLPGCFDKIMNILKPDGAMLACVFGGDTLMELRQSLQLAETERKGGIYPHVSPFARVRDIGGLLTASGYSLQTVDVDTITVWYPSAWHVMHDQRALGEENAAISRPLRLRPVLYSTDVFRSGYSLQTVDVDSITVWYPSAWHVMHDLRALGEGNAAISRPLRLDRDVQFAAAAIYDEMYGKELEEYKTRGVPVTFEIINFLGWKPSPDQPKPLPRGSAELSLKDLHRIDEIVEEVKTIQLTEEDKK